jgi:RNA polymerase sigma factor (sigma-70 family)
LAAVPSTGRASGVEAPTAQEAAATRELYERYSNQILSYCLHQLGSREEAEDAVQSTFLNAFRGLKRGVVPEQEAAWLFKIAQNVCLSRRRATWRRGRIESPTDFELVEELTPAPSRQGEELMGLQDVLEQLPETQRRAILLREWQGLSYREIADELEVSQSAVETLIFRARRTLAKGLEAPPELKRAGLRRGADLGNLLAGIKSVLLGGAGAAKVAATVAVVSGATVAATAPVEQHLQSRHHAGAPVRTPAIPAAQAPATQAPATQAMTSPPASAERAAAHSHRAQAPSSGGARPVEVLESPAAPDAPAAPATPAEPAELAAQHGSDAKGERGHSRVSQSVSAGPPASPPGHAVAPGQAKKDARSHGNGKRHGAPADANADASPTGNGHGKGNRKGAPLVPATLPPSPSLTAPGQDGGANGQGASGDHGQGRGH